MPERRTVPRKKDSPLGKDFTFHGKQIHQLILAFQHAGYVRNSSALRDINLSEVVINGGTSGGSIWHESAGGAHQDILIFVGTKKTKQLVRICKEIKNDTRSEIVLQKKLEATS